MIGTPPRADSLSLDEHLPTARSQAAASTRAIRDVGRGECIRGARPPRWFVWENADGKGRQFVERVILDANLGGHAAIAADFDGDGDVDVVSTLWGPRKDNANGGNNHVDFLENLTRGPQIPAPTPKTVGTTVMACPLTLVYTSGKGSADTPTMVFEVAPSEQK